MRTYGAQSVYGGEITIAGAGAVGKVNIVLLSCIIGIALGSQPILGFNYGRKNYSRVVEAYQKALLYGTLVAVALSWCFSSSPADCRPLRFRRSSIL